jgi:hypothetical protein
MSLSRLAWWIFVVVIIVSFVGGTAAETNLGHLLGTGWQGLATFLHSFWTTVNSK